MYQKTFFSEFLSLKPQCSNPFPYLKVKQNSLLPASPHDSKVVAALPAYVIHMTYNTHPPIPVHRPNMHQVLSLSEHCLCSKDGPSYRASP